MIEDVTPYHAGNGTPGSRQPHRQGADGNRGTARRTGTAPTHAGGTYPGTHRRIAPAGGLMGERMIGLRSNET